MEPRILLTGATGFLGGVLRKSLSYPIVGLGRAGCDINLDFRNVPLDSRISEFTHLLHFGSGISIRSSSSLGSVQNATESFDFLESFARVNPRSHIIFPSSGGALYQGLKHDENGKMQRHTENDFVAGQNMYAVSKICHETFLKYLSEKYKVKVTVLRISNPYGELLPLDRNQGLIGVAVRSMLAGRRMKIFSGLDTVRDYLSLRDMASGVSKVISSSPDYGFEIFNLCFGVGTSIREVLSSIEVVFNKELYIDFVQSQTDEKTWSVLDPSKFMAAFAWAPELDLHQGLIVMRDSV